MQSVIPSRVNVMAPGYPSELAALGRLIIDIEKRQNDLCNAVLKAYELNLVEYNALMTLYVSKSNAVTASELATPPGEKPAHIPRICDHLLGETLIERHRQ